MKVIRSGVFETNSSSTHSICITKNNILDDKQDFIKFTIGEFGWEHEKYTTHYEKAQYLYTAILDNERYDLIYKIKTILDSHNIKYEFEEPKFHTLSDPSTLPTGTGWGVAFDSTGTYLAVAHTGSPYITIYKRSGDTFTKLPDPSTLPTGAGWGVAFDSTGTYLAVTHYNSPYITIYKRSGDTFTKLPDPSTLPTGDGWGVAFDSTGTYLAVAHDNSPYITIYKRSGDTFTKLSNPSTLPTGDGIGAAFDSTGTYLAVTHDNSPYITIYKRSGDTFTKLSNPSILPSSDGKYKYLAYGYIDHSYELDDFLEICEDEDKLMKFLFSSESFIITGNDNDDYNVDINVNYPHDEYYKGN